MSPSTGGQRDWVQVVCNSGVASAAALLYNYIPVLSWHAWGAPTETVPSACRHCVAAVGIRGPLRWDPYWEALHVLSPHGRLSHEGPVVE